MQQLTEAVAEFARQQIDIGKTSNCYRDIIDVIEQTYLNEILIAHHGNQSSAALTLGINRATLRKKLSRHGLI